MSKRSRRARTKFKATQQIVSRGEIKRSESDKVTAEPKVLKPTGGPASALAQTTRYQYIVPELKRIGIISGILFVIIIVLSIIMG